MRLSDALIEFFDTCDSGEVVESEPKEDSAIHFIVIEEFKKGGNKASFVGIPNDLRRPIIVAGSLSVIRSFCDNYVKIMDDYTLRESFIAETVKLMGGLGSQVVLLRNLERGNSPWIDQSRLARRQHFVDSLRTTATSKGWIEEDGTLLESAYNVKKTHILELSLNGETGTQYVILLLKDVTLSWRVVVLSGPSRELCTACSIPVYVLDLLVFKGLNPALEKFPQYSLFLTSFKSLNPPEFFNIENIEKGTLRKTELLIMKEMARRQWPMCSKALDAHRYVTRYSKPPETVRSDGVNIVNGKRVRGPDKKARTRSFRGVSKTLPRPPDEQTPIPLPVVQQAVNPLMNNPLTSLVLSNETDNDHTS